MAPGIRLETDEPVPDGVRRIAREQLDLIARQLAGEPGDREVHDARKAFKRLRTVLRLAREDVGEHVRRRENAGFRDAGRTMSDARDARVLVDTLDDLVEPGAFERLRNELGSEATQAQEHVDTAAILATVEDARGRVASWPSGDDPMAALAAGLKRIHRRGRRAYETAKDEPSAEHLHELRKRAKDLRYATQILRPVAPGRMRKLSRARQGAAPRTQALCGQAAQARASGRLSSAANARQAAARTRPAGAAQRRSRTAAAPAAMPAAPAVAAPRWRLSAA